MPSCLILRGRCSTAWASGGPAWWLLALGQETSRFSELRRRIEGISQKMLTQTLRGLERDGLVARPAYPTVPVTVEYRLAPVGHSLGEAMDVLRTWAYTHIDDMRAAREAFEPTEL
jgi:DNA-binding HxlR family transcriptional regulator